MVSSRMGRGRQTVYHTGDEKKDRSEARLLIDFRKATGPTHTHTHTHTHIRIHALLLVSMHTHTCCPEGRRVTLQCTGSGEDWLHEEFPTFSRRRDSWISHMFSLGQRRGTHVDHACVCTCVLLITWTFSSFIEHACLEVMCL